MKRILVLVAMFAVLAGCSKGQFVDGSYEAAAMGHHADIVMEVVVKGGNISEINIVSSEELPAMIDAVNRRMIPKIVKAQTTEGVDIISGATESSKAVLKAVGEAIEKAKP